MVLSTNLTVAHYVVLNDSTTLFKLLSLKSLWIIFMQSFCHDPGRIRTCDPWIKSPLLYQLSYRVDVILTCSCTDTQLPFWTLSKLLWRKSFRLIDNQALGTFRTLSNRLLQNTNFRKHNLIFSISASSVLGHEPFGTMSNRMPPKLTVSHIHLSNSFGTMSKTSEIGDFDIVDTSNSSCPSQVTYNGKSIL